MFVSRARSWLCALFLLVVGAVPAAAQYLGQSSGLATGESYSVELGGALWNPTPTFILSSEQFGIPGTPIDFVEDLGVAKKRLPELRLVLRPGRKHKLRLHYLRAGYDADGILNREVVFNGIRYQVGLPVQSSLDWQTVRFGYEYDFIYQDRGFVGVLLEGRYTRVRAELESPVNSEFSEANAPIPAVGAIARFYVLPNISLTGEATGFRLPENEDRDWNGRYFDYDIYGTVNITDRVGVQLGYRSLDVSYDIEEDFGDLELRGVYFAGVVRF
ncbi:MAG: hypothetical protein GEU99_11450 [Luteitalea sp.]|nr:hypothetical protein [Luteitalea sp.]